MSKQQPEIDAQNPFYPAQLARHESLALVLCGFVLAGLVLVGAYTVSAWISCGLTAC